jgi:hypothetical protein
MAVDEWVYFCVLYTFPLFYMLVSVPLPDCLLTMAVYYNLRLCIVIPTELLLLKPRFQKPYKESKNKICFFENINKIDKPLASLTKMRRGKTQINKIRNEKEEIATNTKEIQEIIRDCFENLHSNKLKNL